MLAGILVFTAGLIVGVVAAERGGSLPGVRGDDAGTMVDVIEEAAEHYPQFGGFHVEGRIAYVHTVGPAELEDAEQMVIDWMGAERFERDIDEVRLVEAQYSLAQLNRWLRQLRDHESTIPGYVGSGISERHNGILYLVEGDEGIDRLEQLAEELGIPRDAIVIEISEPMRPALP